MVNSGLVWKKVFLGISKFLCSVIELLLGIVAQFR